MHTLPGWDTGRVGLQGNLRGLYCQRQAGQVDVQGVLLVLEVGGQMVPSLLQNAGGGDRERRSDGERGAALLLTALCFLPQLLEGLFYVLLQNLLHPLNQRHLFLQLLVGGVHDQLVPSPAVPQCQAFSADLQGDGGRSQGLLRLLFSL